MTTGSMAIHFCAASLKASTQKTGNGVSGGVEWGTIGVS